MSLVRRLQDTVVLMEAGKPLAILAFLALSPKRRASRDYIAELFWPGVPLPAARHNLRQSIYRLREATGRPDLLRSSGIDLALDAAVALDCLEGESALASGAFERAVELLRGNFLEGFELAESSEFASWVEAERARFRECRAQALSGASRHLLSTGDAARALELAEELAGLQPFSDEPIQTVMTALARTGCHATAVARYHAYAELLRREMDDEPGDPLAACYREVEAYLRLRPAPTPSLLPLVGAPPPADARAEEVEPDRDEAVATPLGAPGRRPRVVSLPMYGAGLALAAALGLVSVVLAHHTQGEAPTADVGGTYFNPKRGLEGTTFLFDPVYHGGARYVVTIRGPHGWNRDSAFDCYPTLAPQVRTARRAICWTLSAPPVSGLYRGISIVGTDTLSTRFRIDASNAMPPPGIQDVSVRSEGVFLRWAAPAQAQAFLVRISALPFGGELRESLVGGAVHQLTLPRPPLEHGRHYQAAIFALGVDITRPGPAPARFNVSVHDWKLRYDSLTDNLVRADPGDPNRR